MSYELTIARIAELTGLAPQRPLSSAGAAAKPDPSFAQALQRVIVPPTAVTPPGAPSFGGAALSSPASPSFAATASTPGLIGPTHTPAPAGGPGLPPSLVAAPGARAIAAPAPGAAGPLVATAQRGVGQTEAPPGSNDSARIAEYRRAVLGAPGPGPWCAYFASWAARQAGNPLGERGEGFASVDALYAWAERAGRANPAGAGRPPKPGDLVVWDAHTGIVEAVRPDGSVQTIEGNSSDQVARRVHPPGSDAGSGNALVGYVRMS